MNKKLTLTAALSALLVATPALADHRYDGRYDDRYDDRDGVEYARVISATPVYEQVRVSEPRQECRDERVVYREPAYRRGFGPDGLIGAMLGGVAGYQFGKGRGQAAATAAGALIGASIAQAHSDRYYGGERESVGYETRCNTYENVRYENRVDGYDVTYKYHGRLYHTRTDRNPGDRIAVNVDVSPAYSY